jgi:predicted patatin/cPLA2 family phospholipase
MKFISRLLKLGFYFAASVMLGCASAPLLNQVPAGLADEVEIPGIPDARFWGDEYPKYTRALLLNSTDEMLKERNLGIYGVPHNYLAISGGGAHGAFGAGLLYGWTQAGTRPEFTMVTGVSTGALIAPFAFLGSEYDEQLKLVYTTTSTDQIARKRWLISALFSDSIADTTPMAELIASYITPAMVEKIAQEHNKGRRLLIGTVNLDAGRSVIWNIGAIARSEHPDKVHLIHKIMRASASVPVAFPPVYFEVENNGVTYNEIHVDGGTGSQVFVYPAAIDWREVLDKLKVPGKPNVYIIRNSYIDPTYEIKRYKIINIAGRTISSLIRTQGLGDLYEIYSLCQRDETEFNLAYIPRSFRYEKSEGFDPVFMGELFDLGYELAIDGVEWLKGPPGFETE